MLPTFLKTALLGDRPRPFRLRLGLNRGLEFQVDPANKASRLLGLDELELAGVFRRFAARAEVAYDVGAADGWYTVFCASRPTIRAVHAFEPDAGARALLTENVRRNGLAEKVTVHPVCVGGRAAPGLRTLDSLEPQGAPLVKIDVEGAEVEVLRGAGRLLARPDALWIVETHREDLELECLRIFRDAGYSAEVIDRGWYRSLVPELRPLEHNRWITAAR